MYGLIKKLASLAALVGVALLVAGFISNIALEKFEENKVEYPNAVISSVEESGLSILGYKVHVQYKVNDRSYNESISSSTMGEAWERFVEEAELAGMDVTEYLNTGSRKTVDIVYNKEVPKSIKYADYENPSKPLFIWGGIILGGSAVVAILNQAAKKKREERAAEKRLEKKKAKQAGN